MTDQRDVLTLADGFEHVDDTQWAAAVETALRGKSVDSLTRTLAEGIAVKPLHTPADALDAGPDVSRPAGEWGIRVRAAHPDPDVANRWLLEDLEGGATQISVRLDRSARHGAADGVGDDGVNVRDAADLGRLLDGVLLDLAPIALEPGVAFAAAGNALLDLLADTTDVARASLGADPVGALAEGGSLPQGIEVALADLATLAMRAHEAGHAAVSVSTHAVHGAGATEDLDLAVALSTTATYVRAMVDAGLDVDAAFGQVEWRLPVGVDQFLAIAKVRAARRLFARMAEASGAAEAARVLRLHADSAPSHLTTRDPWVNILRGTIACFSAGVAGADSMTVLPFDAPTGVPGFLGRRIARNTQLVLQREGHLARVGDPAAGSWYVEQLTDDLARAAWSAFQDIEGRGGIVAVLLDGSLAAQIAPARADREQAVATRKRPVTGVSEFPDVHEDPVEGEDLVVPSDARASDLAPAATGDAIELTPLPYAPIAAGYEALRDAADARAATAGKRPTILLANLGPIARHTARAMFAKNAFEAGGFEAIGNDGFEDPAAAVDALKAAGAPIAVLCGDDEQYADIGPAFVSALQDAGAKVWVAGRPDDALGADGFVHVGADLLAVLGAAQAAAGL